MAHLIRDVGHDAFLWSRHEQTLEVETRDPAEVERWFASRLDFPVRVAGRAAGGYELEGVRLWHTLSRLAALVRYEGPEGRDVTLFLVSGENLAPRGGEVVERGPHRYHVGGAFTYRVVAWKEDDVAYALVGQVDREELLRLAESLRS
jgi:anti-sigma factor RsiW